MLRTWRALAALLLAAAPLSAQIKRVEPPSLLPAAAVSAPSALSVPGPLAAAILPEGAPLSAPSLVSAPVTAAVPVPADSDLSGAALLARAGEIAAKGHVPQSINSASHQLFAVVDHLTRNGQTGVMDAYSGVFIPGTSENSYDYTETGDPTHDGWSRTQSMNVEHVFPQVYFWRRTPMLSDLHHLMATFEHPNNMRSSLPFGAVTRSLSYHNDAGAKRNYFAFEPPDFTKGRVARAMLYFYARYKNEPFFNPNRDKRTAPFWNSQVETLLDWNRRFPPTAEELRRNDLVEKTQHNRNPFIDNPGLADRIGAAAMTIKIAPAVDGHGNVLTRKERKQRDTRLCEEQERLRKEKKLSKKRKNHSSKHFARVSSH